MSESIEQTTNRLALELACHDRPGEAARKIIELESKLDQTALQANDQIDQLVASNLELQRRLDKIKNAVADFWAEKIDEADLTRRTIAALYVDGEPPFCTECGVPKGNHHTGSCSKRVVERHDPNRPNEGDEFSCCPYHREGGDLEGCGFVASIGSDGKPVRE